MDKIKDIVDKIKMGYIDEEGTHVNITGHSHELSKVISEPKETEFKEDFIDEMKELHTGVDADALLNEKQDEDGNHNEKQDEDDTHNKKQDEDDTHNEKQDEFGFTVSEWTRLKLVAAKYFETSKDAKEMFRYLQLDRSKIDLLDEDGNVTYERINFDYSKRDGDVLAELGIITNRDMCERVIKAILLSSPDIPNSLKAKIEETMKTDKGLFKIAAEIKHYYGVRKAIINQYPNSFECFMRDDRKNNDADVEFIEKALDKDKLNLQYVLEDKKAGKSAGVQDVKYLKPCISEDITLYYDWVVCPYLEDLENLGKDERVKKVNPWGYNHGYSHWSKHDDAWRATAVELLFHGNWLSEAVKRDANVANILEHMFKKLANRPEFVEFCEDVKAGKVKVSARVAKIMEDNGVELTSGTTID